MRLLGRTIWRGLLTRRDIQDWTNDLQRRGMVASNSRGMLMEEDGADGQDSMGRAGRRIMWMRVGVAGVVDGSKQ